MSSKTYEIVQRVKKHSKKSTLAESANGTLAGAGIGMGAGVLIGWLRKGNILLYGFGGMIAGGLISGIFIIKD